MMNNKKTTLRKCTVCNQQKDKRDLIRVVKNKAGEIAIDSTGKLNGRGAYICKDETCIANAKKKRTLNNSLKANVAEEIYQELESYVKMR